MREIKFRVWDKIRKRMLYPGMYDEESLGELEEYWGDPYMVLFECLENMSKDDPCVLMQFTGLLDKNGFGIYEGDIVTTSRGLKGVIKWGGRSAKFYISCPSASHDSGKQLTMGNRENVIGNIYENPELLKEGL